MTFRVWRVSSQAFLKTSSTTAAEKVMNDAAVAKSTVRAMRPASASKRWASIGMLLALGSAASGSSTVSAKASSGTPIDGASLPTPSTKAGRCQWLAVSTTRSRSVRWTILPVAVRGISASAMKTMLRGRL